MPTPSFCSWEAVHHQVAAALHLAPDELAPEWAHICAHAARRATAELRTLFTPKGYTPDQVAASADISTYAHQLGTYFALTAGASLTDLDTKAIAWMDCRQELRDNAAIDEPRKGAEVSIGALQVCRELGNLLRRGLDAIEVTTYDRENAARPTYHLTPASVKRLDGLIDGRRVTDRQFEKLTGRLEALDLGKNEFQLKLEGHRQRVSGSAAFFSLNSLRERLGETVTLEGDVVRDRKSITMTAYRVIDADDE